ncbi:polysaccharide lyase 8 family protein [Staphylococcus agnetis]|uniref:Hyaluronate lyase n=1 Tax=Staphylococcus agnetis TaxID=985762 RepID=A0ABX3Z3A0_9STAP|nr:polysaccharide lyase 8 family protein [Staphylococcus agnetis]OSP22140.1 hyaluronate lyase [Staphylococcus agnetis]OSP23819.1 hyaluronate lyase [Staphylococcus agnetis]OTW31391.1 hyaluronate lyase [Staphylococcus agnetis]
MILNLKRYTKLYAMMLVVVTMSCIDVTEVKANEERYETQEQSHHKSKYQKLKKIWLSTNYGYEYYDAHNDVMKKQHDYIEKEAQNLFNDMNTHSDKTYLWDSAKDVKTDSSHMTKSYKNIERIAEAMGHPKSSLNTDDNVKKLKEAVAWMHEHVYGKQVENNIRTLTANFKETDTNKKKAINWWDYEIGAPKSLTNTLILMDDRFTREEKKTYTAPIQKYVPKSDEILASVGKPEKATGGNLVDITKVKLLESIINEDDSKMKSAIDSFKNVFTYVQESATRKARNGFYKDGSYIDHQDVPYTGAYGVVLLEGISQMLQVVNATSFNLNETQMKTLDHWIDDAFMPMVHKGELLDFVRGRAISREHETSHSTSTTVMKALLRISTATQDQNVKAKYQQYVKTSVLSDKSYNQNDQLKSYADIQMMKKLINDTSIHIKNKPQQIKIYDEMKRVVYHNSNLNYTFGLSLTSDKVSRYESINNENLKGWHTGAGMSYLYNDDVTHYRNHYWPTVNMTHLAGTTTLGDEPSGDKKSKKTFVGGTSLGDKYASIGMDFENQQQTLSAKKSWFILDDKIVFVGSGINNKAAQTTIENRKADGYTLFKNGQPLDKAINEETNSIFLKAKDQQNNIGYHFIKPTKLNVDKVERKGKWQDINKSQSSKEVKQNYYEVMQSHTGSNDQYAYVLYPGIDQTHFNQKHNDVSIIKQENQLHVVKDNVNNVWGIVNYNNETKTFEIEGTKIQIKAKGMYIIKKKDDHSFEGTYRNPELYKNVLDIQSIIKIEDYNTVNKSNSDVVIRFELRK